MIYCIVPVELAGKLHDRLREHFAGEPDVEVIVERRRAERRGADRRRGEGATAEDVTERRLIRDLAGRRAGERRARAIAPATPPDLPRFARRHAKRIAFIERAVPPTQRAEDLDTARVVNRVQSGDREAFAEIYLRFFERVYGYVRSLLKDAYGAEDIAQQTFVKALEGIATYKRQEQPFRAWLFTIARNEALMHVRKHERVEVTDPEVLDRVREEAPGEAEGMGIRIGELLLENGALAAELERLTPDQRQAILLIFGSGLSTAEAAKVMKRSRQAVRALRHRALREMEQRLSAREPDEAPAREPKQRKRDPMRIRFRPVNVIRERRFANMGYGRPPGFDRQSDNRWRS